MYKLLPILLFAYGLAITTDDIYDNSYALIIGINEYEHVDKLNYAVQDAEAIKNLLVSNFNFPKEHIIMLTDKEATLDNIRTKLFEVATSVNEKDRLLVYYAGHGETYDLKSGGERGYLIPVDGNLNNIFATCLPMSDIKEVANVTEAKHVLFLVDACYGGLLAVDARSISKTTPGYIDKITRDNARQIITAGGKGEQVIEKSEWGHSAFAKNLLHGLETGIADEDNDGYITADELGSFLKKRVTIDSDNSQTPVKRRFGSDEGEFVFINNIDIENQTIQIPSKTENNIDNINNLQEKVALLEAKLDKPTKFIQGCTNEKAFNYNPDANIDDGSCLILGYNSSHIKFGDFNNSDSTLEILIQCGTANSSNSKIDYYKLYEIILNVEGFEIIHTIDGLLMTRNFKSRENKGLLQKLELYNPKEKKYIYSKSNGGIFYTETESLLLKAKINPLSDKFCLKDVSISTMPNENVFIGDCIDVELYQASGYITIHYTSDSPIGGYQFNITGVSALDASYGASAAAGFTTSTSKIKSLNPKSCIPRSPYYPDCTFSTVLAFSFQGKIIPPGEDVLTVINFEGKSQNIRLTEIIISDEQGGKSNAELSIGGVVYE